ncbi:MAG: chaperone modulator CbpM [Hyphomicrobiales bacterium]
MAETKHEIITGWVVDEFTEVTIDDITRFCSVRREKIVELVSEGIIEPVDRGESDWRFSSRSLSRAGRAVRLESDLEINLHAVALILDLLDRIDRLQRTQSAGREP